MRLKAVLTTVVVAGLLVAALPAHGAAPSSGTLTKSKRTAKWSGGPFTLSDPTDPVGLGIPPAPSCHRNSSCDHFALKIRLDEGAKVEIAVKTPNPNPPDGLQPITGDDYDIYVYDPNGIEVSGGKGATVKGNEKVTITHKKKFNGKAYDVAIRPWAVMPGSTYSGTAKVLAVGR